MNKIKIEKTIENCLDCEFCKVIPDPDPFDSFCSDDEASVCTKLKNDKQDITSKWVADRQEFKIISPSCRPYNTRKESSIPDWCPLLNK